MKMGYSMSQTTKGNPDFTIDLDDSKVRMRHIHFYVTPVGWLAKLLLKFVRLQANCTWIEEEILIDDRK